MAPRRLILLCTFFTIVTVHSVNAKGEGVYTTDEESILREVAEEKSTWRGTRSLELRLLMDDNGVSYKHICTECDQKQKLSICVRAVQHKWKIFNPLSFSVNPRKSDCKCYSEDFAGLGGTVYFQDMYRCPETTMIIPGFPNAAIEPEFLIGQGFHRTQHKVRTFKIRTLPSIEAQLTGFSLDALNFQPDSYGNYVYAPDDDDSGDDVESSRPRGFERGESSSGGRRR